MEEMMPDLDRERINLVNDIYEQIAKKDKLTEDQIRCFIRGFQKDWNIQPKNWDKIDSQTQLDDARCLLATARIFQDVESENSENAIQCYIRAGELFEWLFRAKDQIKTIIPLPLLASASYQLGRLPAMASSLLAKMPKKYLGFRLFAQFLSADFDQVIRSISEFWSDNLENTNRQASNRLLTEGSEDGITWYFIVELVRTLGLTSHCLRCGEEVRLVRALKKFQVLDNLALNSTSEDISILTTLLNDVAKSFQKATIYNPIRKLGNNYPTKLELLDDIARDLFRQKRGILWTSQQEGIKRLIHESSFALCTPTGSGKTLVANLALVKELLLQEHDTDAVLALYIVPSRALANEVETKLSNELGEHLNVTGLYGGTDWGITDVLLNKTKPTVLVATVEKADTLMRYLGSHWLGNYLKLVILDEAHQVVPEDTERAETDFAEHANRSIRLETFVTRLLTQTTEVVRVALTAVAGEASSSVSQWIEGKDDAIPIQTQYRSMRQIVGIFETERNNTGRILLELFNGQLLSEVGGDDSNYIDLDIPPMPSILSDIANSLIHFNELDVFWTALHLKNYNRTILISIAEKPQQTLRWYRDALKFDNWQNALNFKLPENERDLALFQRTREKCIDLCGEESYELALLDQGIASNYGQMPTPLRRQMIELIRRGICPITVSTSTLTEGVNLPFDIIFVTALTRSTRKSAKNWTKSLISVAEFQNLSGRAGRPGASSGMDGITLVALPINNPTTAPSIQKRQSDQRIKLKENYEKMKEELLKDKKSQVEIISPLALLMQSIAKLAYEILGIQDDELLKWLEEARPEAIIEKEDTTENSRESRFANTLDELDGILLSAVQEIESKQNETLTRSETEKFLKKIWNNTFTKYAEIQENWLESAFVRRGQAVVEEVYPDFEERKKLYHYGYTPYVGKKFQLIEPEMKKIILNAQDYGAEEINERFEKFSQLGLFLVNDRGFGFKWEDSFPDDWQGVLKWWLQVPNQKGPKPDDLRNWHKFISVNIDFRLSVAIGAIIAQAWSEGTDGKFTEPALEIWKETSGLPWFGFWARELLRWGTLEPFVVFLLSKGRENTREEAMKRKPEFVEWLSEIHIEPTPENLIDPQLFLKWERNQKPQTTVTKSVVQEIAELVSETVPKHEQYRVVPIDSGDKIMWIDPAGYLLARSKSNKRLVGKNSHRNDYYLHINGENSYVQRTIKSYT